MEEDSMGHLRLSTLFTTLIIADSFLPTLEQMEEMEAGEMEKGSESLVWDCGSSLYDSFELNSFKRELHTAMASRSLSLSRLSHRQVAPKRFSFISRSLQKLVRSVFKPKPGSGAAGFTPPEKPSKDGRVYFLRDQVGAISTILDAPDSGFFPEISSISRRSSSARFSASSIGISCP